MIEDIGMVKICDEISVLNLVFRINTFFMLMSSISILISIPEKRFSRYEIPDL